MILLKLFLTFFCIGAFTFGGGYAMLPLIQEQVIAKDWGTEQELINFIAVSESTPGPFAVNMATHIGMQQGGILGSVCATLGVVMPSFIVIIIIAKCYEKFKTNSIVKGCMSGLKPAVIGLIGAAIVSMGQTVFFGEQFTVEAFYSPALYVSLAIMLVMAFLAIKKLSPIIIILISAALGIAAGYAFSLPTEV